MNEMDRYYAERDQHIADYQLYELPGVKFPLRGPAPKGGFEDGGYFTCLGAAQTFGVFCEQPYPELLKEKIGLPVMNLGRGGAGPKYFCDDAILGKINNSQFAIIQVFSARSDSNSLFETDGLCEGVRLSDNKSFFSYDFYQWALSNLSKKEFKKIISETQSNYFESFKTLLDCITVPKILFWYSTRRTWYWPKYDSVNGVFNEFPHLVNSKIINDLKNFCDEYVECRSSTGLPQTLYDRRTGEATQVYDSVSNHTIKKNTYYPSPEMHELAAKALEKKCRKYVKG